MKRIVVTGPRGHQRSIGVRFDEKSVTNLGGLLGFKSFVDAEGLLDHTGDDCGSDRYSLSAIVENLIALRVAGVDRLSHSADLAEDPLLDATLGQRPSASTLFRRLARDGVALSRSFARIRDRACEHAMREHRGRHVIALDGTTLTVYGELELAVRGYNLRRRGANCYQPLIAASVTNNMILGAVMRPGNAAPNADADGLINDLAMRLGRNVELLADAGFYGDRLLTQCEALGWKYIVAEPSRPRLLERVRKTQFERVCDDVEIGEFMHQTHGDHGELSVPRRHIVVRRYHKRADAHQATLVDARSCDTHYYITNLDCSAKDVWLRYRRRSQIELIIRDLKESFALEALPSSRYEANAAHIQLAVAAYNLLRLYASKVLDADMARSWGQRLRAMLIRLAARIVRGGRRITAAFSIATPLQRILMPRLRRAVIYARG